MLEAIGVLGVVVFGVMARLVVKETDSSRVMYATQGAFSQMEMRCSKKAVEHWVLSVQKLSN